MSILWAHAIRKCDAEAIYSNQHANICTICTCYEFVCIPKSNVLRETRAIYGHAGGGATPPASHITDGVRSSRSPIISIHARHKLYTDVLYVSQNAPHHGNGTTHILYSITPCKHMLSAHAAYSFVSVHTNICIYIHMLCTGTHTHLIPIATRATSGHVGGGPTPLTNHAIDGVRSSRSPSEQQLTL